MGQIVMDVWQWDFLCYVVPFAVLLAALIGSYFAADNAHGRVGTAAKRE